MDDNLEIVQGRSASTAFDKGGRNLCNRAGRIEHGAPSARERPNIRKHNLKNLGERDIRPNRTDVASSLDRKNSAPAPLKVPDHVTLMLVGSGDFQSR